MALFLIITTPNESCLSFEKQKSSFKDRVDTVNAHLRSTVCNKGLDATNLQSDVLFLGITRKSADLLSPSN